MVKEFTSHSKFMLTLTSRLDVLLLPEFISFFFPVSIFFVIPMVSLICYKVVAE